MWTFPTDSFSRAFFAWKEMTLSSAQSLARISGVDAGTNLTSTEPVTMTVKIGNLLEILPPWNNFMLDAKVIPSPVVVGALVPTTIVLLNAHQPLECTFKQIVTISILGNGMCFVTGGMDLGSLKVKLLPMMRSI